MLTKIQNQIGYLKLVYALAMPEVSFLKKGTITDVTLCCIFLPTYMRWPHLYENAQLYDGLLYKVNSHSYICFLLASIQLQGFFTVCGLF